MPANKNNDNDIAESSNIFALLPLKSLVIFPYTSITLFVGRQKSVKALEYAYGSTHQIFLSAQKESKSQDPLEEEIYQVGVIANIIEMTKLTDGTIKLVIEAQKRAKIKKYIEHDPFFLVEIENLTDSYEELALFTDVVKSLKDFFDIYAKLTKHITEEALSSVLEENDILKLSDLLPTSINLSLENKQKILEETVLSDRLNLILGLLKSEVDALQIERKSRLRLKKQSDKIQKDFYNISEVMNVPNKDISEKDEFKNEITELEEKIKNKKLTEEALSRSLKEVKKLKMMSPMSAEATVLRNYIDWITQLPWGEFTEEKLDINSAKHILETDHYGLEKIKERILEYLAVRSLVPKMKGPVLCFVGPPGVGKTSLAKSIAKATGRNFVRLSLGGVRDEAEIRGHRRTYIGAMPGKIIQCIKKSQSSNPVFLLDEIDKMSTDFRGDPASALLEVLDPEQYTAFNDHYLDLDYDLSHVMFITTANTLHEIPIPLQDRMEIIKLSSYTEDEKLAIAKRYLIPRELASNGITNRNLSFTDQAILSLIRRYTKEAGVRNLQREFASIARKVAKKVLEKGNEAYIKISSRKLNTILGPYKYRYGKIEAKDEIGFVNGLAFTQLGGSMVPIEATVLFGKGSLILTGQLGNVMQESAQAALSYIRSRYKAFGLEADFYQKIDIHLHVPEIGPVDGPSAGITICLSMVSALLKIPVKKDIAMTGEITLRGNVKPIGGLKEKMLAAHRGGIKKILFPIENEKDLQDIPSKVKKDMKIIAVSHMDEVLKEALSLDDANAFLRNLPRENAE